METRRQTLILVVLGMLATVGQRYRLTIDPKAVINIKPQITLVPANGICATLSRR
jgi:hypothetical protein